MTRYALVDTLPHAQRTLAANMYIRNEQWETIFNVIDIENTERAREGIMRLADDLEQPWTDTMYRAYYSLAELDWIIGEAAQKAAAGNPTHMGRYKQLSEHRLKLIRELAELEEQEAARGMTWEPTFDTNSLEYRIFRAAVQLVLERPSDVDDQFDTLTPAEQARLFELLAESA